MGILDKLKSTAQQAVNSAAQSAGNRRETISSPASGGAVGQYL